MPAHGERSAVVGRGTSWFMAQSYAVLRESAGHGVTDAFAASEAFVDRGYDALVAITPSCPPPELLAPRDGVRGSTRPGGLAGRAAGRLERRFRAFDVSNGEAVVDEPFAFLEARPPAMLASVRGIGEPNDLDIRPVCEGQKCVLGPPVVVPPAGRGGEAERTQVNGRTVEIAHGHHNVVEATHAHAGRRRHRVPS